MAINLNLNQYNVNINRKSSNFDPIFFSSNDLDSLIKVMLKKEIFNLILRLFNNLEKILKILFQDILNLSIPLMFLVN